MSRIKQLQKLHHGFHVSGGLNSVSESLGCTTPDDELGEVYESLDASARSPDCHHRASLEGPLFKRSLSTPNLLFPGYSLQFRRPGTILHRFQLDTMRSFYSRPCSRPGTPSGLETSITDHLAALTDGGRKAFRFGGDSDSEDDPDGSSPTLDTDPEFSSPILFHAAPPPTAIVTMCSPLRGAIPSIRDEKLDRACDRAIELQLEERRRSFHLASENRDSKLSIFNSTQSLTKETLQTDREMEKNVEKELEAVAQCSPPPGDLAERINKKVFVGNIGYEVPALEIKNFFSKFGRVAYVHVVKNYVTGKPRGIAFVTFEDTAGAEQARNAPAHELYLQNRLLRVFAAQEKAHVRYNRDKTKAAAETGLSAIPACSTSECHINKLTKDCLMKIFHYLPPLELLKMEEVCSAWKAVALETWRNKTSLNFSQPISFFAAKEPVLTDDKMKLMLERCGRSLKRIDISGNSFFLTFNASDFIAGNVTRVEYLDLSGLQMNLASVQRLTERCIRIKTIILRKVNIGEKELWWLLHNCQQLRHIDLSGNKRITGKCFFRMGPHFTRIILKGCQAVSDYGFSRIAKTCPDLVELDVESCVGLSSQTFEQICRFCVRLQTLHLIGYYPRLTFTGVSNIRHLECLETLHLRNNDSVDDLVINNIARGCRSLKFLDISSCNNGVTDMALRSLVQCITLTTLHFSYLAKVSDFGLQALSHQGRLEHIRCRGCPQVANTGVVALVVNLPRLRELDICGCEWVTSPAIEDIVDAVQLRRNSTRLTLYLGGTSASESMIQRQSTRVDFCFLNLCAEHLIPGRLSPSYLRRGLIPDEDSESGDSASGATGGEPIAVPAGAESDEDDADTWWADESSPSPDDAVVDEFCDPVNKFEREFLS